MKYRVRTVRGLPLRMSVPGTVLERNLRIVRSSQLMFKLLVFRSTAEMGTFWEEQFDSSLGKGCLAAVKPLSRMCTTILPGEPDRSTLEVDQRFFCLVALWKERLGMEVISHESVHAGFAYARRRVRSAWDSHALDNSEESVAYPTGLVASRIVQTLYDDKLLIDSCQRNTDA